MMVWKMMFLFQGCILRFYVNLWGCNFYEVDPSSICKNIKHSTAPPTGEQRHHIHHFVRLQRWWRRSFRMDLSGRYGRLKTTWVWCSIPGLEAFCECLRHVIVDFECALSSASATLVFGYFCLLKIEYHHGCVENDSKWDTESNIWLGGSGHSQINHWFGLLLRFGFLDHFLADGKPCCIFPT